MKRKAILLLFFAGILIVTIASVKIIAGRSPKDGVLKVQSSPTSSVFLENKHIGRTPFEQKVPVGEYTIKLVPDTTVGSFSSWQGTIKLGSNLLTYVNGDLSESEFSTAVDILWLERITSRESEVSVTTNPDGTTVIIDNETKGIAPISFTLTPGDHALTVTSPGFATRTQKIKTTQGYKLNVNIKMALSSGGVLADGKEASASSGKTEGSSQPKTSPTQTVRPASTVPDPQKPYVIIKDTPTGFLRVREDANTNAKELARVNPGSKFTYTDTKTASGSSTLWYLIPYDGDNMGWISGQYVEKVE